MSEKQIDPGHHAVRDTLRVVGPVIALTGLVFLIVGAVDFFGAFGGHGAPTLFWCMFVGILLLPVGGILTSHG
jgi:TRAP-type C4-dicarboxylate transport system permease small subunit